MQVFTLDELSFFSLAKVSDQSVSSGLSVPEKQSRSAGKARDCAIGLQIWMFNFLVSYVHVHVYDDKMSRRPEEEGSMTYRRAPTSNVSVQYRCGTTLKLRSFR